MRNLFICITLLISITGCTPQIFKGMKTEAKQNIEKDRLYPFYSNIADSTHMFNMKISYKGNDFDGFLIIKHIAEDSARVVFTSISGMNIFDFEFSATTFEVHRCIEPMQKRVVLNILKKDFRTLFLYNVPASFKAKTYQGYDNQTGYKVKTANGVTYFITDTSRKELQKVQVPNCITLLNIDYSDFENNFPKSISITHPKIKLNIQLTKIK